ncbi:hypothetical protein [Spirosoma jeollabukense]
MIYLIEDRPERQRQLLKDYVLPPDKITVISDIRFGDTAEEIHDELQTRLPEPKAVLCHRGHVALSRNVKKVTGLQKYYQARRVSFVYFSGGTINANYVHLNGSLYANVNSKIFYENLRTYIEGINDIRTLCFGQKFLLNEFLLFTNAIASHLHQLAHDSVLDSVNQKYLLDFVKDYKNRADELAETYDKVESLLEKQTLTIGQIKDQLRKAILRVNNL